MKHEAFLPSYNNAEQGAKGESGNKFRLGYPVFRVLVGINRSNLFIQLLKTTRTWCQRKWVKATKQMHDAQGRIILAAYIQSPPSDSNYHPLKSLPHPIPGFSNPSKTQINLKGVHRSFQNLPMAIGILSVWGKFLCSTWIPAFCCHSLAFSEGTSSHHGDRHSEQPHHWRCKSEKKAGLWLAQRETVGKKEHYDS